MNIYQVDVTTKEHGVVCCVTARSLGVAVIEGAKALADMTGTTHGQDIRDTRALYRDLLTDGGVVTVGDYTARLHRWPGRKAA